MKKFVVLILLLFFAGVNKCYAAKFNFMVLPADLFVNTKQNYLIYPQSATVISNDIINHYNQHPDMSAIQIGQIKSYLERPENFRFKKEVQELLTNYQDNYVINYTTIQKLASIFKVKQVLFIGCNMDAQNYITRRTVWDALNVPGATVIDPAYRLSTQITLIDPNNQIILWQHNYQKLISSRENRIMATTFDDSSEQLEKIKKYSIKFLSPQVVQETQLALKHISPYQNLNLLHPEVVKPEYVSIDKMKIDSKRGAVRSGRFIKNKSALAGSAIATGVVKGARKGSSIVKGLFNKKKTINVKKDTRELSVDEQIEQMKAKEQAKLELKQAKQRLKYEKQLQKQQLNAAKKQVQKEAQQQLQQEKSELQKKLQIQKSQEAVQENSEQNESATSVNNRNDIQNPAEKQRIELKSKNLLEKINDAQQAQQQETHVTPTPVILQKDNQPTPFVRTRSYKREIDYTINDI